MHWARDYYAQQSRTFARGVITDAHRSIAARLHGWCGGAASVLELGAGAGGVAAALADLGPEVWAVEFNPADAQLARALAAERAERLHVVEADFYEVDLGRRFDFVFYWDGFGIGSDDDQRRLLRRIAADWLAPGGRALIDVFSPWNWMRRDGETSTHPAVDGTPWQRTVEFDAAGSRFRDLWRPAGESTGDTERSQSIRCYSLPELALLCEGTGLVVESFLGVDGRVLDPHDDRDGCYLMETNGYYALLAAG